MLPEPLYPLEEEKHYVKRASWQTRMIRPLNILGAGIIVIALCLGSLLLFTHYLPQLGVNGSAINPLPPLTQPPTLINQQTYGDDDPSEHDIPTFALDPSTVYATDGLSSIYALQASTGKQLRRIADSNLVGWSVLANNNVLYTTATPPENGRDAIEAWNTRNDALLWSRTLWGSTEGISTVMSASAPLVLANGVIYVCASPGGGDYSIYAIHANDGAPLWSHDLDTHILPEPSDRITVAAGVIYISSSEGSLTALSAKDGSLLWNDGPAGVNSLPTVANGIIYASINTQYDLGPHVDNLVAVSAATGKVLRHYTLQSGPVGSAVVVGNTVYIGSDENKIYAFAANSGALKWSSTMDQLHALPRSDDQNVFVGTVTDNTVLVGSEDGYIIALQADTGALRWYYQTDGLYTAPTITQGDIVYAQSDYPDTAVIAMTALNIQSGQQLWSTSLGAYVGPTTAVTSTTGITPHLPGIPSFTVEDVQQYLKTHTFPTLNTTGTPTITFTNYKEALGMIGVTEGRPGEASAPSPQDKELVCIVIWKSTYYDQARQEKMANTSFVLFSANTGEMMESGSSGGPA